MQRATTVGTNCDIVLSFQTYVSFRIVKLSHFPFTTDQPGETGPTAPAAVQTAALYENTELQPPPSSATGGDHMYEHVELRPVTGQEKEIEVAPNASYGTVRR